MTEKKSFLLRLPQDLYDELRRWAEDDLRSLNGQIEWILRSAAVNRGRMKVEQASDHSSNAESS